MRLFSLRQRRNRPQDVEKTGLPVGIPFEPFEVEFMQLRGIL